MFAGLAWGAGYVESVPNFEFLTVLLFAGGFVLGPGWGALSGGLGAFLFSAVNPYGSGLAVPLVLAAQVAGMAFAGAVGGFLGRAPLSALPSPFLRAAVVVAAGIGVTVVYDLLTNLASAVLFGPLVPTLVAALPFAAVHVGTNAVLFAGVGTALVGALERTRRSLLPAGLAFVLLLAASPGPPPAWAQADGDSAVDAGSAVALSARESVFRRAPAAPDSIYRDLERRSPPPPWGDGPATLSRRGDASAARWATREGGMTERFADERGSAEPLSRFGLPGARLELDWLGLSATAPGAVGGATTRIPWHAVGAVEAPRLPVSARHAFRGEAGEVRFLPWRAVPGHPRVTTWAALGSNEHTKSGFLAHAVARSMQGLFALESQGLGPLAPLGPEGDHALSGALRHERGPLALEGAYRSAREAIEDPGGRPDTRAGEAGRVAARWAPGAVAWSLALERTDERVAGGDFFAGDTLSRIAKTDRARLEVARPWGQEGRAWAAVTYGRETLESEGAVAFPRRTAHLVWGAAGVEGPLGAGLTGEAVLGAGRYGGEKATFAPSLLVEKTLAPGMRAWAGAARGLGARLDPRGVDEAGDPLAGDPPVLASSTWLAGIGLERRSAGEERGGDARGAWPRGSHRARAAVYVARSTPGLDVAREPLAVDGARAEAAASIGTATELVAFVAGVALAPLHGVRVELGGHALARSVDPVLSPSDPEWRLSGELEARDAFLGGDLDLRAGVLGEAIGPRAGTPVGDLPAAARVGIFAGFSLDDFHVRAEVRDLAGRNRQWPVFAAGLVPRESAESRFVLEARWTFWD